MGFQAATSLLVDGDKERGIGWLCKIRGWPSKAKSSRPARTSRQRYFIGRVGTFRHEVWKILHTFGYTLGLPVRACQVI
jgi:hypothetical protein